VIAGKPDLLKENVPGFISFRPGRFSRIPADTLEIFSVLID
jgi:hypothetical protein